METQLPKRFYTLDVLRGFAALSVVLHHWGHFFWNSNVIPKLPLNGFLFVFYQRGWIAVDLFFSISGFVFYWLYSNQISVGALSPKSFFWLRFSRIYPLHFMTLCLVAAGQAISFQISNTHFLYQNNNLVQFLHHLFLATAWSPWGIHSYNAPVWSVSIEVVLYSLFVLLCKFIPIRASVLLVASAIGFYIIAEMNPDLGRGVLSFFIGGCVYRVYQHIVLAKGVRQMQRLLVPLALALWALTIAYISTDWGIGSHGFRRLEALFPVAILFPLTILALSLLETRHGPMGLRLAVLGDISYSVYLLHFPLQLLLVMAFTIAGVERSIFSSPFMLLFYFSLLLPISYGSYRFFEKPAQQFIRDRMLTASLARAKSKMVPIH